jgi:Phosphodiester glycosidase
MERQVQRHLSTMGIFVAVWLGVALGGVPQTIHTHAGSGWHSLASGMQLNYIKERRPSLIGDSRIAVLRMDPTLWELEAIGISQTGETVGHTAREWSKANGFTAVINAGMFESDNKTHLGYMRHRDHVYNSRVNAYQSVMAFDPRDGKKVPAFRIVDLDMPGITMQNVLADYASVVQNLRLIKRPGVNQWGQQDREWSEAAVGEDSDGRLLFIYSRSPFSMHDLNAELLAAGIGVVAAQHLEGGPEAQLYVHAGATELEMFGSYETAFKENDQNATAWPVPNVLGVRPRSLVGH